MPGNFEPHISPGPGHRPCGVEDSRPKDVRVLSAPTPMVGAATGVEHALVS